MVWNGKNSQVLLCASFKKGRIIAREIVLSYKNEECDPRAILILFHHKICPGSKGSHSSTIITYDSILHSISFQLNFLISEIWCFPKIHLKNVCFFLPKFYSVWACECLPCYKNKNWSTMLTGSKLQKILLTICKVSAKKEDCSST